MMDFFEQTGAEEQFLWMFFFSGTVFSCLTLEGGAECFQFNVSLPATQIYLQTTMHNYLGEFTRGTSARYRLNRSLVLCLVCPACASFPVKTLGGA